MFVIPASHVSLRVIIAGGPRTGKTTLAYRLADVMMTPVLSTDDLIGMGWSEASAHAAGWFDLPAPWIVEGVAAVRALRKWLASNPCGAPCDVILFQSSPLTARSKGQEAMAKGCETVWQEIYPDIKTRNAIVHCL